MSIIKIHKKSSSFWKHGKHKGLKEVSIIENKKSKNINKLEQIDLSKSDWSKKEN